MPPSVTTTDRGILYYVKEKTYVFLGYLRFYTIFAL